MMTFGSKTFYLEGEFKDAHLRWHWPAQRGFRRWASDDFEATSLESRDVRSKRHDQIGIGRGGGGNRSMTPAGWWTNSTAQRLKGECWDHMVSQASPVDLKGC